MAIDEALAEELHKFADKAFFCYLWSNDLTVDAIIETDEIIIASECIVLPD